MDMRILLCVFVLFSLCQCMSIVPYNLSLTANETKNLEFTPFHVYMDSEVCDVKKMIGLKNRDPILMSPSNSSCVVGVKELSETKKYRLVITFKKMDMDLKVNGVCTRSRLDLFSGQSLKTNDSISDKGGLCGTNTAHMAYETKSPFLTLKYEPDNLPSGHSQYFEAVITPFHNGPCEHYEFKCKNGKCIQNNMLCDSYNNCGDDSDETSCGKLALTVPAIVGIVVGSVVLIAILATICICYCCGCCGCCGYERL